MDTILNKSCHIHHDLLVLNSASISDGNYVYIETSVPRRNNDKARLQSPSQTGSGVKCLTFWYHMYGSQVRTLNVYVTADSNLGTPVWTKSGTQGSQWKMASVDYNLGSKQIQYTVSGSCGRGTEWRRNAFASFGTFMREGLETHRRSVEEVAEEWGLRAPFLNWFTGSYHFLWPWPYFMVSHIKQ